MPAKPGKKRKDPAVDLLQDLLITELAKAGAAQAKIRKIVGCDIRRVSRIARFFKKKKGKRSSKA